MEGREGEGRGGFNFNADSRTTMTIVKSKCIAVKIDRANAQFAGEGVWNFLTLMASSESSRARRSSPAALFRAGARYHAAE